MNIEIAKNSEVIHLKEQNETFTSALLAEKRTK